MRINVPNALSLFRILLVPLFVFWLLDGKYTSALVTFAAAGVSDGLDGLAARLLNQRTVLGSYLDPAADKFMMVSAFVLLAYLGELPNWISILVISRDLLIVFSHLLIFLAHGQKLAARPSLLSKLNTWVQIVTVVMALLPEVGVLWADLQGAMDLMLVACAVTTTGSGVHYLYREVWILVKGEEK